MPRPLIALLGLWITIASSHAFGADDAPATVGVATVEVTPIGPIRLVGYASRTKESEGVASPLRARAMAIGSDAEGPVVILAVDTLGIPGRMSDEVARRLKAKVGLPRDRFVVCSTHTHCGPAVGNTYDIMFGGPLPADQKEHIDRYTASLLDSLERVCLAAMAGRSPGRISWGQGEVGFAANRRVLKDGKWTGFGVNPKGPVDRSLPVLRVTAPDGDLRAVIAGYACHCTTLGGEFNKICAEWAGYACDAVEAQHPGSVAMVIIGCAGDANPEPRRNLDDAKAHGASMAREIERLLKTPMAPLPGKVATQYRQIELPFGTPPTAEALRKQSARPGPEGYFARVMLDRLDRGEALAKTVTYPIQTFGFGDALAMVFLGGEVVVDYDLRIKRESAPGKLWVAAYSNDVPCYIASKRMLPEGGYEVDSSMIYYGKPTRLAPEAEDLIIKTVHELLPPAFNLGK